MHTHEDSSHENSFIKQLRERAKKAQDASASIIAAGSRNERPGATWRASNGMHCQIMPDDPQGILRVSVGGGPGLPVEVDYTTIRGDVGKCIALLEKAIAALKECP